LRRADEDNPRGYYEFERVKKLPQGDIAWLDDACGKAVKAITYLLVMLPPTHSYRVILMERDLAEVLASQREMLKRRGMPDDGPDDTTMARLFEKELARANAWIESTPNVSCLRVSYRVVVEHPRDYAKQISAFLGGDLDVEAMMAVADRSLYRQRRDS
jgi:hypothetical protein